MKPLASTDQVLNFSAAELLGLENKIKSSTKICPQYGSAAPMKYKLRDVCGFKF
jgi:hypothetical protein